MRIKCWDSNTNGDSLPRSGNIWITVGEAHGFERHKSTATKWLNNNTITCSTPSGLIMSFYLGRGLHPRLFKSHPFRVLSSITQKSRLLIRIEYKKSGNYGNAAKNSWWFSPDKALNLKRSWRGVGLCWGATQQAIDFWLYGNERNFSFEVPLFHYR